MESQLVRILLVEDSTADATLVNHLLKSHPQKQFQLAHAKRLAEAKSLMDAQKFDVILLDLGLPDSEGLESLKTIRASANQTPVVVLTGTIDDQMGVNAIRMGAQDYLPKSAVNSDTLSRSILFALERHGVQQTSAGPTAQNSWRTGDLEIDLPKQTLFLISEGTRIPLSLTPIEFRIFVLLFQNHNQTITRGQIVAEIWGDGSSEISFRTVDRHISSLKKKSASIDRMISSIYGVGYRLEMNASQAAS